MTTSLSGRVFVSEEACDSFANVEETTIAVTNV